MITRDGFAELLAALKARGYRTIGPTIRDETIVYDDVAGIADLPRGWTAEQEPARYRLQRRNDDALFGFAVGPHSPKRQFHRPIQRLFRAKAAGGTFQVTPEAPQSPKLALIGVRACELAAIGIQDRVFTSGPFVDPYYQARRKDVFLVAVNCTESASTCFCASMDSGPQVRAGYDLALTELSGRDESSESEFVVCAGSTEGAALLEELPSRTASAEVRQLAAKRIAQAAEQQRRIDNDGINTLLNRNLDNPRWDDVASRCLGCANCTMVCPTCFCSTVEDVNQLATGEAERVQRWDSCFAVDFAYIHGGTVRSSTKSRYRQWLTHKLGYWVDQFGSSGCVGCGRCITWCPVGIDMTEEVAAIRQSDRTQHRDPRRSE